MSIRSYMCAKKRELADDDAPDAAEPAEVSEEEERSAFMNGIIETCMSSE